MGPVLATGGGGRFALVKPADRTEMLLGSENRLSNRLVRLSECSSSSVERRRRSWRKERFGYEEERRRLWNEAWDERSLRSSALARRSSAFSWRRDSASERRSMRRARQRS